MAVTPFKLLLVDGTTRDWVVCEASASPAGEQIRAKFKEFHGHAPSPRAVLWIIPAGCKIQDDMSYTIAREAVRFAWVKVGEIR